MLNEEKRNHLSTVTLFISFDLVNCTLFKSKHKGEWVTGVSSILDHVMRVFVDSSIGGYRFWKMLGDEVLYTKEIKQMEEVASVVDEVYFAVTKMNKKIQSMEIGDEQTAEILSVKATIWIADISPISLRPDNIYVEYEINKNELKAEYLGTDIDGGFRIAQYTSSNRLVIASDLAALFLKEESLRKNFHKIHFVAFRKLKGIWRGDPYPIFMYHGDESVSFKDSIIDTSNPKAAILKEYLQESPYRVAKEPYDTYEEQLITQFYDDPELAREVHQLMDIIHNAEKK